MNKNSQFGSAALSAGSVTSDAELTSGEMCAEAPTAKPSNTSGLLAAFLSEHQLAAELGKSSRTIARWRALRVGPPWIRLGERVIYRREAVLRWLVSYEHPRRPERSRARSPRDGGDQTTEDIETE